MSAAASVIGGKESIERSPPMTPATIIVKIYDADGYAENYEKKTLNPTITDMKSGFLHFLENDMDTIKTQAGKLYPHATILYLYFIDEKRIPSKCKVVHDPESGSVHVYAAELLLNCAIRVQRYNVRNGWRLLKDIDLTL